MAKLCAEDNIAMTPYSALAGGRLSKAPGETSKRLEEDSYAKLKYDAAAGQDGVIIGRVMELAAKHGVSMTEVSLAWLLQKVAAPVVGATKMRYGAEYPISGKGGARLDDGKSENIGAVLNGSREEAVTRYERETERSR